MNVPWLVGPATGDVEWFALPTGQTLCAVSVTRESDLTLASASPKRDESPAPDEPGPKPAGIRLLQETLRQTLIETLSDLHEDENSSELRVSIDVVDPWLAQERADLLAHPSIRIAIAAASFVALREFLPESETTLSDDVIAQRAAESIVGEARAPFFEHWAYAAISQTPVLAATYPDEACISCKPSSSSWTILTTATPTHVASEAQPQLATDTKAKTIRRVRASRTDAAFLSSDAETLAAAFENALFANAMMSAAAGAYPLQSAVEGLTPTSIPGVFLLPGCSAQNELDIELVLRAHATEFRIYK